MQVIDLIVEEVIWLALLRYSRLYYRDPILLVLLANVWLNTLSKQLHFVGRHRFRVDLILLQLPDNVRNVTVD
jgi:hypothetical protein